MDYSEISPQKKALQINLNDQIYGTFAEIGAGQEVARHFFQAGRASHTVAKTISAYDMTFSDAIYGKEGRYVCQSRVLKMLDHEYALLLERLEQSRGQSTQFFAFADTVATSSQSTPNPRCHGWMGVRYQHKVSGSSNDIILHVRLLDSSRLQQQEALGILGVNLIYGAFYLADRPELFVTALMDSLGHGRLEIDVICFHGPDLKHIDNRLINLELVKQGLTEAILFAPNGEVAQISDTLFQRSVLVQRGTFRPVTNINIEILQKGLAQMKKQKQATADTSEPLVLFELTMHNLSQQQGDVDAKDFLDRVDTLSALGHHVLVSNFYLFYQLKTYLRHCTDQDLVMILGASHLEKLFNPKYYSELPGGILEAFGRLFDPRTQIYVYPYKSEQLCTTASTYNPDSNLSHLYRHLLTNGHIADILGCDDVDTSIHARDVRNMLANKDKTWENLVPKAVRDLIQSRKLFQ